jgi:hypothetical protein
LCLLVLHSTDVAINPHKCSFVRRSWNCQYPQLQWYDDAQSERSRCFNW